MALINFPDFKKQIEDRFVFFGKAIGSRFATNEAQILKLTAQFNEVSKALGGGSQVINIPGGTQIEALTSSTALNTLNTYNVADLTAMLVTEGLVTNAVGSYLVQNAAKRDFKISKEDGTTINFTDGDILKVTRSNSNNGLSTTIEVEPIETVAEVFQGKSNIGFESLEDATVLLGW